MRGSKYELLAVILILLIEDLSPVRPLTTERWLDVVVQQRPSYPNRCGHHHAAIYAGKATNLLPTESAFLQAFRRKCFNKSSKPLFVLIKLWPADSILITLHHEINSPICSFEQCFISVSTFNMILFWIIIYGSYQVQQKHWPQKYQKIYFAFVSKFNQKLSVFGMFSSI